MPRWIVWAGRVGLGLNLLSLIMNAGVYLVFQNTTSGVMAAINAVMCLLCLKLL